MGKYLAKRMETKEAHSQLYQQCGIQRSQEKGMNDCSETPRELY